MFSTGGYPPVLPLQGLAQALSAQNQQGTVNGDLSARVWKIFAAYLVDSHTDIYNTSMWRGEYPNIYKFEVQTPVAQVRHCLKHDQIRDISGLLMPDKVFESLLAALMIEDMKLNMDISQ